MEERNTKFCENCGAKLEENAEFCDECGTKTEKEQPQFKPAETQKRSKATVIAIIVLVLVFFVGAIIYVLCSGVFRPSKTTKKQTQQTEQDTTKEPDIVNEADILKEPEETTLKESLEWNESSEDIEAFKKLSLLAFPEVSIAEALKDEYSVKSWKHAINDEIDYLMCNYSFEEKDCSIIFYKDIYDGINAAEYYINDKLQEKEFTKEALDKMFQNKDEAEDAAVSPHDAVPKDPPEIAETKEVPKETEAEETPNKIIMNPNIPPEGKFWDGDKPPYYADYYVDISNTSANTFDFKIYQAKTKHSDGGTSDFQLVFKLHTAVFTDDFNAVYEGKEYTLYFDCSRAGYLNISGFNEVIPDGAEVYNNAYLGVS